MQLKFAVPITTSACSIDLMQIASIGQQIAHFRERMGLSQSELARRLGVKPQAVQKWESGGAPRTKRLEEIARALGTSVESLVGHTAAGHDPAAVVWPFNRVPYESFNRLSTREKTEIEDFIEMKVAKAVPAISGNKHAA